MYGSTASIQTYRNIDLQGSVTDASPHRLVQMLMDGVLQQLTAAAAALAQGDRAAKAQRISRALNIVEGLQINLDKERGGELAENLEALYDYMARTLLKANLEDRGELIEEVAGLMRELRSAWSEAGALLADGSGSGR